MSEIRPLDLQDVPQVASMFMRVLRKEPGTPSSGLVEYLSRIFLEPPGHDPEIVSQVHVRDDGSVSGFIGVIPLALTLEDRPLRAAIASTYMVEDHENDPFAGARLLRRFLAGPQDISLTETANDISTTMWRKMRGTVLADYSLEWLRVIRPAAFMIEAAARAARLARLASPLARPFDALIRRSPMKRPGRISHRPSTGTVCCPEPISTTTKQPASPAFFIRLSHASCMEGGGSRSDGGPFAQQAELWIDGTSQGIEPLGFSVGMFLYYGDKARIGRTIQILAAPGHEGAVIDAMLADADQRGLAALRGRTQPALLNAMLGPSFQFRSFSIQYRPCAGFVSGDAVSLRPGIFQRLCGGIMDRLIGGRFD